MKLSSVIADLPAVVPLAHVVHGPARQMFHFEAGHVDNEDEAVDLNVLIAGRVRSHDHPGTNVFLH